jgi:hypothetical protein
MASGLGRQCGPDRRAISAGITAQNSLDKSSPETHNIGDALKTFSLESREGKPAAGRWNLEI